MRSLTDNLYMTGQESFGNPSLKIEIFVQGIPAFRDFTIRDSRYFVIPFH